MVLRGLAQAGSPSAGTSSSVRSSAVMVASRQRWDAAWCGSSSAGLGRCHTGPSRFVVAVMKHSASPHLAFDAVAVQSSRLGPVLGLILVVCWTPMVVIIFRLPALADLSIVADYWGRWAGATQLVIASVVVGYPALVVFLVDARTRWVVRGHRDSVVASAAVILLVMFVTCLNVSLGLASAGGQLVAAGHAELGAGLHVAAFVLAAPATGLGAGGCLGLLSGSWVGALQPRWLRWPALLAVLGNVGTLGGLFALDGVWNSGNGLLGGIAVPLGAVTCYVFCASAAWVRR